MRILVVDDDPAARLCLAKILEPLGEVAVVGNGPEALAIFAQALVEGRPYGLVCLDILMPGLDGQATLQALRSMEQHHAVTPGCEAKVIMVTGLGDTSNVSTAFFRGQADGYVQKPLSVKALQDVLADLGLPKP